MKFATYRYSLPIALCLLLQSCVTFAFSPIGQHQVPVRTQIRKSALVVFASEDPDSSASEDLPPPPQPATPPPPVPPKRLDPLMASLTRMDPGAVSGETRNVPFFGEVPVDGGLVVLIPAAVIAILGFILSIVVAVNSQDALVASLSNVADDISKTAKAKTNRVYDKDVCRGICSSQEKDLDSLRGFMEGLRK